MKEQEKTQEKNNYIAQSLTGILDIIICLLLFISSIYKGAFYKSDFLFSNAVISVIGTIYLIYKIVKELTRKNKDKKPRSKVKLLLDTFMLILPFTYALPIIFKTYVSLPDSIFELLRYVNMTVIYYIVRNTNNEKLYLNIFVLISVAQSILGIDQLTFRNFEEFLNTLSTGYLPDLDKLSATLQYANITGIVISFGVIICFNNLSNILEKRSKYQFAKMLACILFVLLQFTSAMLTGSRVVAVILLLLLFINSIFDFIYVSKKSGIYKLILIVYSVIVSGVIERIILNNEYSKVYICIVMFSLLFVGISVLIQLICILLNKNEKTQKILSFIDKINNRYVKFICIILTIVLSCILISIPKDLKITSNKEEAVKVQRNIYDYKNGKNAFEIKIKTLEEDTRYYIEVIEIKDDYSAKKIATFNYYDKISNEFKTTFKLDDNVQRLNVTIEVEKGSIKVDKFKLNREDVKLSYLFIPDNIAFKIQDTFYGVYGDSLRVEYVKDAIKLFNQNPIIGIGGEGFKHTYGSVQSVGYISSEAHSAVLQALVEVGIIGTTIFIGIIALSLCLATKLVIRLKKISIEDKKYTIVLISIYFALLSVVIFDLAFSYAFMIYIFAVVTALLLKVYMDIISKYNERDNKQSKIDWSYVKIIVLSLSLVTFLYSSYFSVNAYRASLIRVPNKEEDLNIIQVAENIAYLELKTNQDRFDMDYKKELNEEYIKYKSLVTQGFVNVGNDEELRKELNKELNGVIVKIKENTDLMLEYEYYDKYVLNDVADVYIDNYMSFANIYEEQFSTKEVAYAFYLNYVLKLTDRIIELNPLSKRANDMYYDMCNKYIEELEYDNRYLNSEAVSNVIQKFKDRIKFT